MIVEIEEGISLEDCPFCGSAPVMRQDGELRLGVTNAVPFY